ncbi:MULTISPECIES: signal recognition particle-docking protein FtsY [Pseudanabaena]|jgi:fused signal recognition particle receptor|uniref:signal recognition particle-docking protein FtsY n=1 Tax=Pseudanabaena TaxID=1152 RepID=UPI00247963F7|nr:MULTISPECIES: signal recognition particle-docking protein FtsY [Pseudanabaena]MEA5488901.1 signal recognition particle-docking protein FtsY [Pseudanabaena sp. CCNP1317]WGS72388.1 signal recognition particle-docking protein FtsY [Pseudanabaena galeata CCNP1313]
MVFNWFRRKFDDDKSVNDQSVESPQAEEKTPESTPVEDPSPISTPASQDLLNWAKAAYANVQQQAEVAEDQATEAEVPEPEITEQEAKVAEPELVEATPEIIQQEAKATEPEIAEPEIAEPEAALEIREPEVITELQVDEPAMFEAELEISESVAESSLEVSPETTTEVPASVEPAIEPAIAEVISSEVVSPEVTTPEPEAVPFWMQSESDRQARIAALEATAIIEPEPEVKPVATSRRKATIKFDDDFIWSAEVLASQGRRPEEISVEEITWLNRLRQGLDKTRLSLVNQLKAIVGQGPLSADSVDDIEALLLQADVGVKATDQIIAKLQDKLRKEVLPPEEAIAYLKQILREMLDVSAQKGGEPIPMLIPEKNQLNIWLITGVNGAGKTTTIGKLSHLSVKSGYKTLIAAADTFRAAAVEQVKSWGQRSNVDVICNPAQNADPAAVVFDAISAAQARGTELLLVDTAGRLQNKKNLMEELSKIRRIVDKKSADAKIESLLVLDSTLGQNGLKQAEVFAQSAGITGVILTKLDGTAKGGVAIAVVQQLGLPIRFIGAGEGIEDLRPFSSYEFVEALLSN